MGYVQHLKLGRKFFGFLFLAVFSFASFGAVQASEGRRSLEGRLKLETTVAGVVEPTEPRGNWIFLLSAGGVALRLEPSDRARIELLSLSVRQPRFFEIEFERFETHDRILHLVELSNVQTTDPKEGFPIGPMDVSASSTVGQIDFQLTANYPLSLDGIFRYWKSFGLTETSQCFDRAYYWTHQLWRQTGIAAHKVFLFFTPQFMARTGYGWWFHVAPFVFDSYGREVVLDPTFLPKPVGMKAWTDNFLRHDPYCPEVSDFKGYTKQGGHLDCYLVKTPMYYYHPSNIEESNNRNEPVRTWHPGYLRRARTTTR